MIKIEIGQNLKKSRELAGYSQRDLAKLLNVSNGTVASWETNRTQPDKEMLQRLSSALNVPYEILCPVQSGWKGPSKDDDNFTKFSNLIRIIDCYDVSEENKKFLAEIIQDEGQLTKLRKMYELMGG